MLYTTREAAERLGVSGELVRKFCRTNDVGRVIGGTRILNDEDVEVIRNRNARRGRPTTQTMVGVPIDPRVEEVLGRLPDHGEGVTDD